MRPHEEKWEWDAEAGEAVRPSEADSTKAVAVDFADEEAGTLGAAAPKMARALLAMQRCEVAGACRYCAALRDAALKDAGVLS